MKLVLQMLLLCVMVAFVENESERGCQLDKDCDKGIELELNETM
jgi:hypothetical protein